MSKPAGDSALVPTWYNVSNVTDILVARSRGKQEGGQGKVLVFQVQLADTKKHKEAIVSQLVKACSPCLLFFDLQQI